MTKNDFIRELTEKTNLKEINWERERDTTLNFIPNIERMIRDFVAVKENTKIYVVEQNVPGDEYGDDRITVTIFVVKDGILATRIFPEEIRDSVYEDFIECLQNKEETELDGIL